MVNVQKKCPACGEANEADAAFCTNCGRRFEETADVKKCPSCGETNERYSAFCTNCGNRLDEKKTQNIGERSLIGTKLLELANEFLVVREVNPGQFEFSSQTGAQSAVQNIKIKYEAVVQLEPEKKLLAFWEKIVETSAGTDTGFFAEKTAQKGIEVGKKIHGQILFGGKYGFEYGKLREVVKAITNEHGWEFKTAIFKPKKNIELAYKNLIESILDKKILIPVLALFFIAVLGSIGYLYFSHHSTSRNVDELNNDKSAFRERSIFQRDDENAGNKNLVETEKDSYDYGEKIVVRYYNAPGYSRDWICIVPAGSRNTDAGDYKYIPRRGLGVLTFNSPPPGQYEVRAFYKYSPGRYRVTARYNFTVEN
ncbi:MAG: zinc ribbon domain-containing protein [Syntrophaceae bacterium]|nr:zinc ribbon domain-containing protein [Syntrophaceae bacterium]